jgi:hypothetical protein
MKDYIPEGNPEFDAWQENFVTQVNSFKTGWNWNSDGIDEWDMLTAPGNVKQARWEAAWAKVSSKQFYHSDEMELKEARQTYESGDIKNADDTSLRLFIKRYIRYNKRVSDQQKKACRLTVSDTVLTAASDPGTSDRVIQVELIEQSHGVHKIGVYYSGTKSRAKPKGIKDILVYMAVQATNISATPDVSAFQYVGDMKRASYIAHFTLSQEGMKAFYFVREKSTRGVLGNMSRIIGVVIS